MWNLLKLFMAALPCRGFAVHRTVSNCVARVLRGHRSPLAIGCHLPKMHMNAWISAYQHRASWDTKVYWNGKACSTQTCQLSQQLSQP